MINGSKIWTSLGTYAKYMILLARTSTGGANKYAGLSYFLAPMNVEGVDPKPIQKLTGEYGFCQTYFVLKSKIHQRNKIDYSEYSMGHTHDFVWP